MPNFRLAILTAGFTLAAVCAFARTGPSAPIVVAYVFPRNGVLQPGQIDAAKLNRINYAFANIKDGLIVTGFAQDEVNLAYLATLRKQNPSLKILVSVGGWLWSGGFSDVSLTIESRQRFIQSVMEFLAHHHLDGLDIDWEYPGMTGAGNPFRSEDGHNFTLLLKELRIRFDEQAHKTGRRLYLTIAAGSSDEYLAHTEMSEVQRYVDTVNLMAYDYYEPGSGPITGHHAPLFTNPADPAKSSADSSVLAFERAGVPASKILLGVPFYGHMWGHVADTQHGLYQPGLQIPNAYAPYTLIGTTMLNHGFTRYWDPVASVPYLYNAEQHIFVSYEDSQSLTAKCNYVLSRGLGGVMFWEYSGDPSGTLLSVINKSLHRRRAGETTK
jgi:chitinase